MLTGVEFRIVMSLLLISHLFHFGNLGFIPAYQLVHFLNNMYSDILGNVCYKKV